TQPSAILPSAKRSPAVILGAAYGWVRDIQAGVRSWRNLLSQRSWTCHRSLLALSPVRGHRSPWYAPRDTPSRDTPRRWPTLVTRAGSGRVAGLAYHTAYVG